MMTGDVEHFFKYVLVRCLTFIVSVQLLSHVRLCVCHYGVPIIYDYINFTLKLL